MRKHLISGWCRHISTEGCKHARTQCLNQQKPLLSFKKHKNNEIQNSENTAAANNKVHSLKYLRSWEKPFWVLKNTEKHVIWDEDIPYHIHTALFYFLRSNCNEKGCDLVTNQYKYANNCSNISSQRLLVAASQLRSFGHSSRGMKMRLFAVKSLYIGSIHLVFKP